MKTLGGGLAASWKQRGCISFRASATWDAALVFAAAAAARSGAKTVNVRARPRASGWLVGLVGRAGWSDGSIIISCVFSLLWA